MVAISDSTWAYDESTYLELLAGQRTSFVGADLSYADLSQLDLSDYDFSDANCRGTLFMSSDLTNALFIRADLTDADFGTANNGIQEGPLGDDECALLYNADFTGSILSRDACEGGDFVDALGISYFN